MIDYPIMKVIGAIGLWGFITFAGVQAATYLRDLLRKRREAQRMRPALTWPQTVEVLKTITYRRNVVFGWSYLERDQFVLQINAAVRDADNPESMVPMNLKANYVIPLTSRSDLILRVYKALREFELHECGEFFRVDGVKLFDPHARVPMDLINGVGP